MKSYWYSGAAIGIVLLAALLMLAGHLATAQPEAEDLPRSADATPDRAVATTVDTLMADFARTTLAGARESGGAFPAYARWIDLLSSAVAANMPPGRLSRNADPLARLGRSASELASAASAAERELRDVLPSKLPGRDLRRIAAFKQRTRPTSLTVLVLHAFYGKPQAIRAAGARRLGNYRLDPDG